MFKALNPRGRAEITRHLRALASLSSCIFLNAFVVGLHTQCWKPDGEKSKYHVNNDKEREKYLHILTVLDQEGTEFFFCHFVPS